MSLSFVCLILVTLFKINTSATLTDEQVQALQQEKYFIHPEFSDEELNAGIGHVYHGRGDLSQIQIIWMLNQIQSNYAFKKTKVQHLPEVTLDAFVFEHEMEHHRARGRGSSIITIHYHCYLPGDEEPLIIFYNHISNEHSKDELFVFESKCQMYIEWKSRRLESASDKKSTAWVNIDKLSKLYVRAADDNKRILYLSNIPHRSRSYDFWKASSSMFDHKKYLEPSFVFNPIMIRYQSEVGDPCNNAEIVAHQGIVLVDSAWGDSGYLPAECLKNIHLQNIAKQWREIWRPVGSSHISPQLPNDAQPDGTPSPPTTIETSVEVMHRTQSIPPITWNECALLARRGYIRECTIKSVGDDCVCDSAEGIRCAHHCSKLLYLMPSIHADPQRSVDLRKLIHEKESVKFVATELESRRFKREWDVRGENLYQYRGDYSDILPDVVEACRVAMDPRNVRIKKLILADLEPNSLMYFDHIWHLLRPENNAIYPIWVNYYGQMWMYIRNLVMVPTINGVVYSEMRQSEAIVLPIGMKHYDPLNGHLIDILMRDYIPAELPTDRKVPELMHERAIYNEMESVFSEHFGQGVKDLLEHPEKLKKAYKFRARRLPHMRTRTGYVTVSEYAQNHKLLWE